MLREFSFLLQEWNWVKWNEGILYCGVLWHIFAIWCERTPLNSSRTLTLYYPLCEIIVKQNACHKYIFLRLYDKILMWWMTYREVILCFAFIPPAFFLPSVEERKALVRTLKDFGLTLTTSRIYILHHLKQTQIPLTASDLSKQIELPLSTTHRNLSMFADCGLVDFIVDRASVCRWYFLFAGRPNFCPTCNQTYNAAYWYNQMTA